MITFKSTEDISKLPADDPAHAVVKELIEQLITAYSPPGRPYDAVMQKGQPRNIASDIF